jgi:hypothetical protein
VSSPIPVSGPLGEGAYFTFVPNEAGFLQLTRSPTGAVARDLVRRAAVVQEAARQRIPLGHVAGGPGTRRVANRNLRDTLRTRIAYTNWAPPVAYVGSDHPIALIHHEGSRPHVILPRRAKALAFWPRGSNQLVFAKRVNHPGSKPNPYLRDSLHLAVE